VSFDNWGIAAPVQLREGLYLIPMSEDDWPFRLRTIQKQPMQCIGGAYVDLPNNPVTYAFLGLALAVGAL